MESVSHKLKIYIHWTNDVFVSLMAPKVLILLSKEGFFIELLEVLPLSFQQTKKHYSNNDNVMQKARKIGTKCIGDYLKFIWLRNLHKTQSLNFI
jgi:hypothetical protein